MQSMDDLFSIIFLLFLKAAFDFTWTDFRKKIKDEFKFEEVF